MDILLRIPPGQFDYDISIENGDLAHGDDLETAVIISLFTWARAKDTDDVPAGSPKYGYWGDQIADDPDQKTGSRLWLLLRRKLTPETINDAVEYIRESLKWMVTDGVISRMSVTPEIKGTDEVDALLVIYRHDEQQRFLRFSELWKKVGGTWHS